MPVFEEIDQIRMQLEEVSDRTHQVQYLSEYILEHLKATSTNKSKSTGEILKTYKELLSSYPDLIPEIPDNTFAVLLSKVSSEQYSRITCPGRKQGYYLEQLVVNIEKLDESQATANIEKNDNGPEQIKEKHVYPILKQWLFEKDYDRVADISNQKTNGKWGNPDLVGLNIEDIYGRPDVEITTIEVKLTQDNWEEWIFEAIAHTRFSNRSYFAFLYPENLINKLDSTEIKLYAEHFKIGILIIGIHIDDYVKIKSKQPAKLNPDNIKIIEYFQAPFNQTHIQLRKKFLRVLDILELNKLYSFGEELN